MHRWALAVVLLLAGCGGGGGGGGSGIDPRLARLETYDAQRLRVLGDPDMGALGMAQTPDAQMPTTGQIDLTGFASIRIETAPDAAVLAGDAVVSLDFMDATVTGSMSNFFGTDPGGTLRNYDGILDITDGTIGDDGPATWVSQYSGVLSGGGQTLIFDGELDGRVLGDPVAAIAASDVEAGIIYDGTPVDGIIVVVGEGQLDPG